MPLDKSFQAPFLAFLIRAPNFWFRQLFVGIWTSLPALPFPRPMTVSMAFVAMIVTFTILLSPSPCGPRTPIISTTITIVAVARALITRLVNPFRRVVDTAD